MLACCNAGRQKWQRFNVGRLALYDNLWLIAGNEHPRRIGVSTIAAVVPEFNGKAVQLAPQRDGVEHIGQVEVVEAGEVEVVPPHRTVIMRPEHAEVADGCPLGEFGILPLEALGDESQRRVGQDVSHDPLLRAAPALTIEAPARGGLCGGLTSGSKLATVPIV